MLTLKISLEWEIFCYSLGMNRQPSKPVPAELMRWSWAAFLTPWAWTFDNHIGTYPSSRGGMFTIKIGSLVLPGPRPLWFFRRYGLIYLGRNGNRLAWQARNWKSIEDFNIAQKHILWKGLLTYYAIPFVIFVSILIVIALQTK